MFKDDGRQHHSNKTKGPGIQPKIEYGSRLETRSAPPVYRPASAAQTKRAAPPQSAMAHSPSSGSKPFEQPHSRLATPPVYRPMSPSASTLESRLAIVPKGEAVQMSKWDTLKRKKERKIRGAKIYSGQHGGQWVPSGSAGGVHDDDAEEETKADAIARLFAEVRACVGRGNPAKLVKAIRKRIHDAEVAYGPDPEWQHFRNCLDLD